MDTVVGNARNQIPVNGGGPKVSPISIDFGTNIKGSGNPRPKNLLLTNDNSQPLTWSMNITHITGGKGWLKLSSNTHTISANSQQVVTVHVDMSTLVPGAYQATLNFTSNAGNGGQATVNLVVQ